MESAARKGRVLFNRHPFVKLHLELDSAFPNSLYPDVQFKITSLGKSKQLSSVDRSEYTFRESPLKSRW
jgi:hypothetical protein